MDLKPAAGKVAIEFLEDLDEKTEHTAFGGSPNEHSDEAIMAVLVGVGDEVKGLKKGQTVLVHSWTRDATRISDNTVICESYCVLATVKQ